MNEKIQREREFALGILKPSRKELEHGLELHANSVVCDAYGFAPSAAIDGDAIHAAIGAGASETEIRDMIVDMTVTRCVTNLTEQAEYKEAWDASGVTCLLHAGQIGQSPMRLIKKLASCMYVTDMMPDFVAKAVTPDDIIAAKKANRHCLYLTTNEVPLTQEWVSVEEELRYIRVFFQLGVRMMHLTYNRRNMMGDGCSEPDDAGLSEFGRDVVAEMNRVGVIVDVAHSGWRTSLEAAKASERPMVASHSACCALNPHRRGKPDEVIHAIADTGGYMGIGCVSFLGDNPTIETMLDHLEYATQKFGSDHVAIGTDFAYVSARSEAEHQKIPKRRSLRTPWEWHWLPGNPHLDPTWSGRNRQQKARGGLGWTNWPLFTVGLVQRGFSDEDIQKIVGGNVLRVARAVLPAS